ncbi:MAG: hypothetical protein NVS9B1_27630 [Candidatus Dormibacteraceae bacterium]
MPLVANIGEAVLISVAAALTTLLAFIPALIGAVIILVIGWFLADIVARLVTTILRRVGFETMAQRTGVSGFITMTGARDASASMVIGELVKWFIRLIFIEMAAQVLHVSAITGLINSVLLFIPNLIIALVIVMIGVLVANFVAGVVRGGAGEMGMKNPNILAGIAKYAIIGMVVLIALSQVGIAATFVNALFIAFVAALALAAGLAFGLGGREVAGQMWNQWYSTGRGAVSTMEEKASTTQAEPPAMTGTAPPPPPSYESATPPPMPYEVRHERRAG